MVRKIAYAHWNKPIVNFRVPKVFCKIFCFHPLKNIDLPEEAVIILVF